MALSIPFASERARLREVIHRLRSGSAGSPAAIDQFTSDELSKIYKSLCGFRCGCPGTFADGLKDQPIVTLLSLLLCPEAGVIALAPDFAPIIVLAAVESFAVISGADVNNTGNTIVNGNLGSSPGVSITGFPPGIVNGVIHNNDATSLAAQVAAFAFYLEAIAFPGGTPVTGDIGGQTLTSGIYTATTDLDVTSADLTLSGGPFDVFLFQVPGNLSVAAGKNITVTGGATARNVYWLVGGTVDIGAGAGFNGTILGIGDQTLGAAATLQGRLISHLGTITLNDNVVSVPLAP